MISFQEIEEIGNTGWTREEMKKMIPEFLELYKQKPVNDNQGGMKTPHMFATWFMLKKLNPKYVIESGVWKGQGTWLIEKALPSANIYSIDPDLSMREYKSDKVNYFDTDFFAIDWSIIPDKKDALLFFDDHQNALERIRQGKEIGFRNFIFEDNYPAAQGDCYSLKKAFQHSGFTPQKQRRSLKMMIHQLLNPVRSGRVEPNTTDSGYLKEVLNIYYEFPPVFKKSMTRWGDDWDEHQYPTPPPLFDKVEQEYLKIFEDEAVYYTWICYAALK
jgi:hypothetical protein